MNLAQALNMTCVICHILQLFGHRELSESKSSVLPAGAEETLVTDERGADSGCDLSKMDGAGTQIRI